METVVEVDCCESSKQIVDPVVYKLARVILRFNFLGLRIYNIN